MVGDATLCHCGRAFLGLLFGFHLRLQVTWHGCDGGMQKQKKENEEQQQQAGTRSENERSAGPTCRVITLDLDLCTAVPCFIHVA